MLLAQTPSISHFLDQILAGEKSRELQHVVIDSTVSGGESHRDTVDLRMDRKANRFLFTLSSRGGPSGDLNRTYYVSAGKLTVYDASKHEYVVRPLPKGKPLGVLLISLVHIDPGVLLAIDPASANDVLFKDIRATSGWTQQQSGNTLTMKRAVSGGQMALAANRATWLPTVFNYSVPGRKVTSTLTYGVPISSVSYSPPASSHLAKALPAPTLAPHFQSNAAAALATACKIAYDKLRSVSMKVEGSDATSIAWENGKARQVGPKLTWAYDGNDLSILDTAKRRLYRGHASRSLIPDYLSLFGTREEPILLQLMARENPVSVLYARSQNGRLAGSMTLAGVPIQILELSSPSVRTLVQIRTDNHLITGLRTENLSASGNVISRSAKNFTYSSVNSNLVPETFKIAAPVGYKVLALNQLPVKS